VTAVETREAILKRISQDLIGPLEDSEVLLSRPLDVYLSGILWPLESEIETDEDDGALDDEDDAQDAAQVSVFGQMKPSTMGLSFAVNSSRKNEFDISYSFANYQVTKEESEGIAKEYWHRTPIKGNFPVSLNDEKDRLIKIPVDDLPIDVRIHVRNKIIGNHRLVTVTLINYSKLDIGDKVEGNQKSIFQTHLSVTLIGETTFRGLPDDRLPIDEDEKSIQLLYSEEDSYAVGHQCSATWSRSDSIVSSVKTTWIPVEIAPMFSQKGHKVFLSLIESGALSASKLANDTPEIIFKTLNLLADGYSEWIYLQKEKIFDFKPEYIVTAQNHINQCESVLARIRAGINILRLDKSALEAFRVANMSMATQHSWKFDAHDKNGVLIWRPFQMAFFLLTLDSICNKKSPDREILDLLWFPTGGGKTEAYLAIIGFGSVYQRLTRTTVKTWGNYAIMRYTLRLLTAQQFERASAMILSLELIRQNKLSGFECGNLGDTPFSIGLWVGEDATPNNYDVALNNRRAEFGASAEQVLRCFACKVKLQWSYSDLTREVRPQCENDSCVLGKSLGKWPIITIDEDIYRVRPTLLIGTVDKFAQLPRKSEIGNLFGFKTNMPSELIIQDELHLISGPLGTIVGAYEVAIDWLLTYDNVRPKVIGSTATIRRAQSQVRALFDRASSQFPPPGLTYRDSGFAVVDEEKPGRLYVGISNAGRSAKFSLQAIAGSLLQSGGLENIGDFKSRDGYSTLLMYFNNLRELGAAIVQVLDDVPDSIDLFANRRSEKSRSIDHPRELTSTRTQTEIIEILEDLHKTCDTGESVDVVLATNMVSVGVDVSRLGLMQVNGQPKTRSEYIQATSRVGRSDSPGLVVVVHNVLRARDRSHFETFASWHRRLYRDVEATSVTPFASRSRDRTLKTIVVSMVRHSDPKMLNSPKLINANPLNLQEIVKEIERRVNAVNPEVLSDVSEEIRTILDEWNLRDVDYYLDENAQRIRKSLLQSAERFAQKMAAGLLPGYSWPVMNAMRSVEASTPFRLKEKFFRNATVINSGSSINSDEVPPWRQI
jgi:hypothetical protein